MSADNKNCLSFVKIIAGLAGTHADNVSTMHVHRCAYNSCNTVQCVHMPMSTSESWFTLNHAMHIQ